MRASVVNISELSKRYIPCVCKADTTVLGEEGKGMGGEKQKRFINCQKADLSFEDRVEFITSPWSSPDSK